MVSAFKVNRVTGNMRAVNWQSWSKNWDHLKSIKFLSLGPHPIIDMLIGIDYAELHSSLKEITRR